MNFRYIWGVACPLGGPKTLRSSAPLNPLPHMLVNVNVDDASHIFLIDHTWTYKTDQVRQQLSQVPALATSMARLITIEEEKDVPYEELVEEIMSAKWSCSQTYSIGSAGSVEDRQ